MLKRDACAAVLCLGEACIRIAALVRQGALAGALGSVTGKQSGVDPQKEVDVLANDIVAQTLQDSPVAWLASEELEVPLRAISPAQPAEPRQREDAGQIATFGRWELLVQSPDATQDVCDALAAQILLVKLVTLKEVSYTTDVLGLSAGQSQTIVASSRGINNTFLLTQVNTDYQGGVAFRRVSATEGLVYHAGWRELTRDLFGGGGGVGVVGGGGGGGGSSTQRYAYFFGASGDAFVESATPTWVAAGPMVVQVNTVQRASTQIAMTVQLRALSAGISVQARIFDVTAGTPCTGLSAVITSTSWQTAQWVVTLNPGSHLYRLELLPGAANEPVGAIGYGE